MKIIKKTVKIPAKARTNKNIEIVYHRKKSIANCKRK